MRPKIRCEIILHPQANLRRIALKQLYLQKKNQISQNQ